MMKKLICIICVVIVLFVSAFALADTAPLSITTTFDKDTYEVGTEITATYQISGGSGSYKRGTYYCYSWEGNTLINISSGELDTENKSGIIKFTPKIGDTATIDYSIYDSEDRYLSRMSQTVKLSGNPKVDPLAITTIFDKDTYEVGTEITATYQISGGSGSYKRGTYYCYSWEGNTLINISSGELDTENKSGIIKFTPKIGNTATIDYSVYDSDGRYLSRMSQSVKLTGKANVDPLAITTTFDKDTYEVGTEITATYQISGGSGSYKRGTYYCYSWEGNTLINISSGELDTENKSGIIKFTPKIGNTATIDYSVYDSEDRYLSRMSQSVNLVPSTKPAIITEEKITAYVDRCYEIILGRSADEGGRNTWVNELNSGRKAAAEIIEQFVASAEFQNKNLSNADAVEILYKAMLGRGSDPAGKADWLAKLNAGQHITAVINGFCGSAEFKAICDSYGIQPGTVTVKDGTPVTPGADNEKIKAYVERCYQIILGRGADEGGLNTWMDELTSGRKAAAEIIEQFVASAEFQNKKLSNSDSVEILYKAMLGRGSDPAGKASWVEKLDAGQDLTAVINGFCGSAEFKAICDSYGIQPGTVTVKQPTAPAANDEKIQAFVARCYKIILGRDADEGGMSTWFNELKSGRKAAAEIIESFVNSQEFKNKNYSNADAVEILYKAMLGRGSDPAGKADWVEKLNAGQPVEAVINGFCGSAEFKAICDAYGITPGTVNVPQLSKMAVMEEVPAEKPVVKETVNNVTRVEITNVSDTVNENLGTAVQAIYINEEKAKEFIGRCYRVILGREASQAELDSWIGQMTNGSKTADQIARGFLFSGEFKGRNIGNEELVQILYRVYMNREADPEGLATWTQKLDEGTSLNDLLNVFAKTGEFRAVLKDMAQ